MAAIRRTSTDTGRGLPTGRISPSCSARSNLTWKAGEVSPISSRNSVPPSACWNRPMRVSVAPVNAPRLWPKSSLSSSVSGMAPQFSTTKGRSARGLA